MHISGWHRLRRSFRRLWQDAFGSSESDTGRLGDVVLGLTRLEDRRVLAAPTPVADAYFVPESESAGYGDLFVSPASGLLLNDSDADGDPLTIELVDPPQLGTLSFLDSGGAFYYYNENYPLTAAVDTFTYRVSDGINVSDPTTVTLYLNEIVTLEDTSLAAGVLRIESFESSFNEPPNFQGPPRNEPIFFARLYTEPDEPGLPASLYFGTTDGLTFTVGTNGDSYLEFSGTQHDLNLALSTLTYIPGQDYGGEDGLILDFTTDSTFTEYWTIEADLYVEPVADQPFVFAPSSLTNTGPGTAIPLSITAYPTDIDGSETLDGVFVSGLPDGVTLNRGTPVDGSDGTVFLTTAELIDLQVLVGEGAPESFELIVSATAAESLNSSTASAMTSVLFAPEPMEPLVPMLPDSDFEPPTSEPEPLPIQPPEPPNQTEEPPSEPKEPIGRFGLGPLPTLVIIGSQPRLGGTPAANAPDNKPANNAPLGFVFNLSSSETGRVVESQLRPLPQVLNFLTAGSTGDILRRDTQVRGGDERGLYVRAVTIDGQTGDNVRLPDELSTDYSKLLEFLRALPNGEYIVFFRLAGQPIDQAAARQRLLEVRVVNHELNPDADEFKPAGEVDPSRLSNADSNDDLSAVDLPAEPLDNPMIPVASVMVVGVGTVVHSRNRVAERDRFWEGFRGNHRAKRRPQRSRSANVG